MEQVGQGRRVMAQGGEGRGNSRRGVAHNIMGTVCREEGVRLAWGCAVGDDPNPYLRCELDAVHKSRFWIEKAGRKRQKSVRF